MSNTRSHLREVPRARPVTGERLDSWKEIARYLNREIRTVQRWEETEGLPVYRLPEGRLKRSPVYAYASEIDAWLHKNPPLQSEQAAAAKSNRVVVPVFENRTGDRSLDSLGQQIADSINSALRQVGEVQVAASPSGSRSMEYRRLAGLTKSSLVVAGAYYVRDGRVELHAQIVDPWAESSILWTFGPIPAPANKQTKAIDLLCRRVAGALAFHFTPECELGFLTPPLLDAFRESQLGRAFFGVNYGEAIRHFEKARSLDPEFWFPQLYMFLCWRNQGIWEQAESQLAMLEASQGRMTIGERLWVRSFRAELEGRLLDLLAITRDIAARIKKFRLAVFCQGLDAIWVNQPREAIQALTTIPVDWYPLSTAKAWPSEVLAQACHMVGDFEAQLRIAQERIVHFPDSITLHSHQGMALAALGRLEEVDRVIDDCLTITAWSGTPANVMEDAAHELRAHGHPNKALAVAEREISWLRSRPPEERKHRRFELGQALYLAEHWQEAGQIFQELVGEAPRKIDSQGHLGTFSTVWPGEFRLREQIVDSQGYLGALAVRLGDHAEAERIAESLRALSGRYQFGHHTYCRARIASLLGEKDKAVELLRDAFSQGYRFTLAVHRDPDFEPLRDYPPYQELIRPKD